MATRKEGVVLEREWKRGRGYALRIRAYGERHYVTLGHERDGWDWAKAETELENVLADVRRGLWVPPKKKGRGATTTSDPAPREIPEFGPFAKALTEERDGQVAPKTTGHEEWANGHLIPFFGDWPIIEINAEGLDSFRAFKAKESEARARAIKRGKPKRNERGQILNRSRPARSIG